MQQPTTGAEALTIATTAAEEANHRTAARFAIRAAHLADQEGDTLTAYHARRIVGRVHLERDEPTQAVRVFRRALVDVEGIPALEAMRGQLYHDLAISYGIAEVHRTAATFFDRAARIYGAAHPLAAALAADRAFFQMEEGDYRGAAVELRARLEEIEPGTRRVVALGNAAVALAGAGCRQDARGLLVALQDAIPTTGETWPRVALAWTLALLGERERAKEAARAARQVARDLREVFAERRAVAVLRQA